MCCGKMLRSVISAQLPRAGRSFSQGFCSYSCCTRLCSLAEHLAWNKCCRWSLLSLQQIGEVRETRSKENQYLGLENQGRWTWTLSLMWVSASGWGHGKKFIFLSSDSSSTTFTSTTAPFQLQKLIASSPSNFPACAPRAWVEPASPAYSSCPLILIKNHVHPPLAPASTVCIFNFVCIKFSGIC